MPSPSASSAGSSCNVVTSTGPPARTNRPQEFVITSLSACNKPPLTVSVPLRTPNTAVCVGCVTYKLPTDIVEADKAILDNGNAIGNDQLAGMRAASEERRRGRVNRAAVQNSFVHKESARGAAAADAGRESQRRAGLDDQLSFAAETAAE